jgi:hypothetical protein
LISESSPFAVNAVGRVNHYMELTGVDEEDLGLILALWLREYDDTTTGELLDEEDRYFEMYVHGRDVNALRDPEVDGSCHFDAVVEFGYGSLDVEEFLDVEYWT